MKLRKETAVKLVRDKSYELKKAYREQERMLNIPEKLKELSGVKVSVVTVHKVLSFQANPDKGNTAPIIFATFNKLLDDNAISPIDFTRLQHHFPKGE